MHTFRIRRVTTTAAVAAALATAFVVMLVTMIMAAGTGPAQAAPQPTPTGQQSGSAPGQESDCVGLVVDSGPQPVVSTCVPVSAGLTGQQLLTDAGHKLTFDKNGFICQIDNVPATCTSDNTHYWAYFHRAPGAADDAWEYSQKGAAEYTVHPGETDGWAYQDNTQRQPEAVPYPTLRQAAATASATPTESTQPASAEAGTDDGGANWTLWVVVLLVLVLVGGTAARTIRRRRNG